MARGRGSGDGDGAMARLFEFEETGEEITADEELRAIDR